MFACLDPSSVSTKGLPSSGPNMEIALACDRSVILSELVIAINSTSNFSCSSTAHAVGRECI